ncbi:hypothetical protein [Spirochaeta lutea]|uniref:hypothetical protein n=1 Tax=Spirochaeta lutea TaxID=1480694 RepID=UPI000691CC46|nr:hypothetical protein [Spirochaeta lutea]
MSTHAASLPTVIVPYPGPAAKPEEQDIFVYLRPETNGVLVESTLLKVIKTAEQGQPMKLVYMANFPGEFIVKNTIVEQYYSLKLHFAVVGKRAFTLSMAERFSDFFREDFDSAEIVGSFEALERLDKTPEELFHTWVNEADMVMLNGQTIKRIEGVYVVNYDIPALLHKNAKGTDIAVMIFRTERDYSSVKLLVRRMHQALVDGGILDPKYDPSRAFHYSKGPFEQILDGVGYLYTQQREKISLRDFTFARYLLNRGVDKKIICGMLMNPIVHIREPDGREVEDSMFNYTTNASYAQAVDALTRMVCQYPIIHHGPILSRLCTDS